MAPLGQGHWAVAVPVGSRSAPSSSTFHAQHQPIETNFAEHHDPKNRLIGLGFVVEFHVLLHLGYAYHLSGDKAKAQAALKQVQGKDGSADFARLWVIVAK